MAWQCYLIEPTDRAWRCLRRFTYGNGMHQCRGGSGHDASVEIGVVPLVISPDGTYDIEQDAEIPRDDPRWPTACDRCGAPMPDEAEWQVFHDRIYVAADGREFSIRSNGDHRAPAGAMWEVPWLNRASITSEFFRRSGRPEPIMVMLPDGYQWCMDQTASNGPGWDVTGTPPKLTASPSILSPKYHGYLQNGVLLDDLDRRSYGP